MEAAASGALQLFFVSCGMRSEILAGLVAINMATRTTSGG
jgi:hypothetical protein